MTSIINEFIIFDKLNEKIKQNIKLFYVNLNFAVCVTNDDKVYAFAPKNFGYENIDNNFVLISELCDQNIQQFFYFNEFIFTKSGDHKIFGSGRNSHGQLARGHKSEKLEIFKPEIIAFLIIKILSTFPAVIPIV